MSDKNHYVALGVEKNASQDDIKKAYRKLAVQYHPDKGGDENKFKEISLAYDVLGTPQKKHDYDRTQNPQNRGREQMNHPFDTFFSMNNFFNERQTSSQNQRQPVRKQFHQKLDITLTEAFTGCKKRINIDCEEECKCFTTTMCTNCKGEKTVEQKIVRQMGNTRFVQSATVICSSCSGSGRTKKASNENITCGLCNDSFVKKSNSTLEVRLDQKTFNDFTTKIPYPKNKNNDLCIDVHIVFPPFFSKENNDLIYTKEVTLFQVLLGVEFDIDHPSGKKIAINYKKSEEIIRPETSITYPGEGVGSNSNLIVKFKIRFPKRNLLPADDEMFKEQISELFLKYFIL